MRPKKSQVAAVVAAALAGCAAPTPPAVTFYADGESAMARPQILCDIAELTCDQDPAAVVRLRVRPGHPVQVSVPAEVAESAWGVVFSYLDRDGERVDASSRIFVPENERLAYTLELPEDGDRLLLVAVQRLVFASAGDATRPVPTGYWVLEAVQ